MRGAIRTGWLMATLLTIGLAHGSCLSSTGPELGLTFLVDPFDPSSGELPTVSASASPGVIRVTGGIETPCVATAGEIRGSASRGGSDVQLQIRWQPTRPCEPSVDPFVYEALLRLVPPGTYRLSVTHVFPDHSDIALQETITVP